VKISEDGGSAVGGKALGKVTIKIKEKLGGNYLRESKEKSWGEIVGSDKKKKSRGDGGGGKGGGRRPVKGNPSGGEGQKPQKEKKTHPSPSMKKMARRKKEVEWENTGRAEDHTGPRFGIRPKNST